LAAPIPEHLIASLLRDPDVARGFQARSREHERRGKETRDCVVRVPGPGPGAVPHRPSAAVPARTTPGLQRELAGRLEATRRNKR
jgi:hypothetical protein